ncbi:MAG: hypothetical protein MUF22_02835 [Chitinispirillaceae bacterium]|jgi:type IV pilus assembly protein PilQ|nr:hypothetical protein [Chitinispirillaceae bacterium]
MGIVKLIVLIIVAGIIAVSAAAQPDASLKKQPDPVVKEQASQRMTFDFKDTDIRDIVRSVSIAYGLNIIIDKDISANVTVHLTDVPVLEGLKSILGAHGLSLVQEGGIYRIVKSREQSSAAIGTTRKDTIDIDIDNLDIKEFIKNISAKTGLNIIAEKGVEGKVSGKLRNINVEDGIRALFEANGFNTRYNNGILIVSAKGDAQQQPSGRYMPGMGMAPRGQGTTQMDIRVKDALVSVGLENADLGDVLRQIAEQSRLNFITYGDVRGEINARLDKVPLEKAISLLIAGTNYAFSIRDSILLVGDRNSATPSGQALSTSELFHLKYIKADDFMTIVPKSIPASNLQIVKEQNAVLVTGTGDLISQIRDFKDRVDLPTPQIMIEVVVVEFNKGEGRKFGVSAGGYDGPKDPQNSSTGGKYIPEISTRSEFKATDIFSEKIATIGFLPENFWVRLEAMETQKKAKVMAQPRIATLNGNKASINVGGTSYFKLAGGTELNPLVRFQEIKSGIRLDITPWISQSGQVTVELSPEISNSTGNNSEGFPDISTRSVNTTVQLNDGETIIIGGLISAEDSKDVGKVPLLGDIPLLGYLFRSHASTKTSKELVIYVTPHLLSRSDNVDLKSDLDKFKKRMNAKKDPLDYNAPAAH